MGCSVQYYIIEEINNKNNPQTHSKILTKPKNTK